MAWRAACLALGTLFLSAAHPDEDHRLVRVQIEWRSSKAECWAGVLETSQGTIEHPASLGVAGDEAGTLWADGKCLWLGRHKASDRDGFEVSVIAPPSAHLSFTLQAPGNSGPRQRFECLLSDLEGGKNLSAKGAALQLSVHRAPGDALRIVVDRPHLIYHPGETFKATLVPDVLINCAAQQTGANQMDTLGHANGRHAQERHALLPEEIAGRTRRARRRSRRNSTTQ